MDEDYEFIGIQTQYYFVFQCNKCKNRIAIKNFERGKNIMKHCFFCEDERRKEGLRHPAKAERNCWY